MSKKEKIETVKKIAGEAKQNSPLTDAELALLKKKGYNMPIFLNSHSPIVIHSDDDREVMLSIARKLDRRVVSFKGK